MSLIRSHRYSLRAYLDGALNETERADTAEHVESCSACRSKLAELAEQAALVQDGMALLPLVPATAGSADVSTAWAVLQRRRDEAQQVAARRWTPLRIASFAGGALGIAAIAMVLTVAPLRAWAQGLLSVFRVQHVTVVEVDGQAPANLENNELLTNTVSHIFSDEVVVTEAPQKPQPVTDRAEAAELAGFNVKLLPDASPSALAVNSGFAMQMKLDRDRLQSILDEAGRSDLRIPSSVDGATLAFRVPAGVIAMYGNCGDAAARLMGTGDPSTRLEADASCVRLMQMPSPTASAPPQIDPAQIAQVVLQFLGMSAQDAANFTSTVDWTSTLVFPVIHGQFTCEQLTVNGNDSVLLRERHSGATGHFDLMWVDGGILYTLGGVGDDATAISLATQLE
jgi:anti-sigma factor RsiW